MKLAWLLLSGLPVLVGQDLRFLPAQGAPGERVVVEVSLISPTGKAPAALQWETIFPAELLDLEGSGPEAGPAAQNSGKAVTCAVRKIYSLICVLAGGKQPISNGVIATYRFRIRPDARIGPTTLRVQKAEGATVDLKEIVLKDAEGTLIIR